MALQDILNKIRSDGASDVQAILATRDAELANITSHHSRLVSERTKIAEQDTIRRATKVAERIHSKARHQVQLMAGSSEHAKLEAVFSAIKTELLSLDEKAYATFLTNQFQTLPAIDNSSFVVAKSRASATTAFLTSKGISPAAIKAEVDDSLLGGFVLLTDKQEFDCSFRGLLQNIRQHHAVEIAQKLNH